MRFSLFEGQPPEGGDKDTCFVLILIYRCHNVLNAGFVIAIKRQYSSGKHVLRIITCKGFFTDLPGLISFYAQSVDMRLQPLIKLHQVIERKMRLDTAFR